MQATDCPYNILGVERGAPEAEIRQAFRRRSLETHPDRNGGDPAAEAEFKRVNSAYELLSDARQREMYDMGLMSATGEQQGGAAFGMGPSPHDIFASLFGQGAGAGGPPPGVRIFQMGGGGAPPHMFDPAMFGPVAYGAREDHGRARRTRPAAQAGLAPLTKRVSISLSRAYSGGNIPVVIKRTIASARARQEEEETLYVEIPPGIDNNEIIRLKGKGDQRGQQRGDVKIFVQVVNDTTFKRDGLDLVYTKSCGLKEALCGPDFVLTGHPSGKSFRVRGAGSVASPGQRKVVRGMGMHRGGQTGDLVIEYDITFPSTLSPEQLKALEGVLE